DFGNVQRVTGNRPPVFVTAPPTTGLVGQLFRYDARATDPDGDPVTYALSVLPAGMSIERLTGAIAWNPPSAQIRRQDVVLRVEDGRGGVTLQAFQVTVQSANSPPVITSQPTGPALVGLPYQYPVRAQDADGDTLTFALTTAPAGMTIHNQTGLVTWT